MQYEIAIDYSRNSLLSPFALAKLRQNYLLENEDPQQMFARVADAYASSQRHAQRLYDYFSNLWIIPATPVLANGGAGRGLPISCFVNELEDSLKGIIDNWKENSWLAAKGGGIGSYYGNLRSIGEKITSVGETSGVIPFMKVQDSISLCISQGSQRSGAAAVYLPISHPEVEEFLYMRRPTGGDPNRKCEYIHQGLVIPDAFMEAVQNGTDWHLRSPKTGAIIKTVQARDLWQKVLTTRLETGEPYLLFIDNVNAHIPEHHKELGLNVTTSNLCSEITLPTGIDHHGKNRTAVCCLSSLNLDTYDQWKTNDVFFKDCMEFLDNVLQDFIDRAPDDIDSARYAAIRERSVGLGAMGFHSYLQSMNIPFESALAKVINKGIFKNIREKVDAASYSIAVVKGSCPDAAERDKTERFSNKLAIAPNASTSIIAGSVSPGIEPLYANSFLQDTDVGSMNVRNKYLKKLLVSIGKDTAEVWSSITTNGGSVQHLDFLTDDQKDVFKTAFELDQRWVIEFAADRTPYICQAQSLNVFLPSDISKKVLHKIHYDAWEKGVKSMYYLRSKALKRAQVVTNYDKTMEGDCLACQG